MYTVQLGVFFLFFLVPKLPTLQADRYRHMQQQIEKFLVIPYSTPTGVFSKNISANQTGRIFYLIH